MYTVTRITFLYRIVLGRAGGGLTFSFHMPTSSFSQVYQDFFEDHGALYHYQVTSALLYQVIQTNSSLPQDAKDGLWALIRLCQFLEELESLPEFR